MRDAVLKTSAIGIGMLLLTTTAVAAELANGDFSNGLTDWTTVGDVSVVDGAARITEDGAGGVSRVLQAFDLPAGGAAKLSFRYRFSATYSGARMTTPPDAFHVALLDGSGARFGFLSDSASDMPSSYAMYYRDSDNVYRQSARALTAPIQTIGLDAEGFLCIEVDLSSLSGAQACRIEFGLACAANECVSVVDIDDVSITVPGLTLTCPADIPVDCDDSLDPSNTGTATATGGCAPNDPVVSYADAEYSGYWAIVDNLGPIHHWPLDEMEADNDLMGSTAEDRIGDVDGLYRYNYQGPAITPGQTPASSVSSCGCRWAVLLGDQTYVQAPHDASMATNNGTVSLWIMDMGSINNVIFLSKSIYERAPGQFVLYTHSDQGNGAYIEAIMTDSSLVDHSVTSLDGSNPPEAGFELNVWHHIVFTFGSGGMKLYLDGVEVGANAFTGGAAANDEALRVGHGMWFLPPDPWTFDYSFFSGKIDEVMWFNRALSSNEVATLYAASGCRQILRTWTALDEDCDPDQSDSCQQVITVSPQE